MNKLYNSLLRSYTEKQEDLGDIDVRINRVSAKITNAFTASEFEEELNSLEQKRAYILGELNTYQTVLGQLDMATSL